MAGSVNKVILVGNLGRDPEVRSTQDGSKIVNLSIATSERWKDKNTGDSAKRPNGIALSSLTTPLAGSPSNIFAKARHAISKASCRPANGPISRGLKNTQPKWFCNVTVGK